MASSLAITAHTAAHQTTAPPIPRPNPIPPPFAATSLGPPLGQSLTTHLRSRRRRSSSNRSSSSRSRQRSSQRRHPPTGQPPTGWQAVMQRFERQAATRGWMQEV
jgi:hypothetical protein